MSQLREGRMACFTWAALLLCLPLATYSQTPPDPVLQSAVPPQYPSLARAARIQGTVKLQFALSASGETVGIQLVSGHPLLAKTALDAVKNWRFATPLSDAELGKRHDTTFEFVFRGVAQQLRDNIVQTTVESQTFRFVRIITPLMGETTAEKCPTVDIVDPPATRTPTDFIELSRSGCYGVCPVYTVRVHRSGTVEWQGRRLVNAPGNRIGRADPGQVNQIIEQFRSQRFWSLCGFYSRSVTDSEAVTLTVNVGGEEKTVIDYADSGPTWLEELGNAVDDVADTHQWRHGNPQSEPISNISADVWYAKPGRTPLMRAAFQADLQKIRDHLANGVDISAKDSSGWTALMYAAASWKHDPVKVLIEAGSDPNDESSNGDTPLMAAAMKGRFSEDLLTSKDLLKAGAAINHQNKAGVTALMILATHGDPDEIADALRAGANADLRDARGRTALDYLIATNCRKNPLARAEFITATGRRCDALDKEEFRKSARILRNAMRPRP